MLVYERRGICYFWTTDDKAVGYCRFDGSQCHYSDADDLGINCKKCRALIRLSNKFKIPLTDLMFEPEGRNVYARKIPEFIDENEYNMFLWEIAHND